MNTPFAPDPGDHPAGNAPLPAGLVEQRLFHGRTHPKILFIPAATLVCLVIVEVLVIRFVTPARLDIFPDRAAAWVQRIAHLAVLITLVGYVLVPVLRWWTANFTVTTRRVRMRWGILYKNRREIPLERVTQVVEERGILDRIFGCGTLLIYDAANATPVRFHDVPSVGHVRQVIDEARYSAATNGHHPHPPQMPGSSWA